VFSLLQNGFVLTCTQQVEYRMDSVLLTSYSHLTHGRLSFGWDQFSFHILLYRQYFMFRVGFPHKFMPVYTYTQLSSGWFQFFSQELILLDIHYRLNIE
jgi:hypothetical protein